MAYRGTYQPNKRPVIATAPDCLVFLNGQLVLPSGGNPNRKVDIQPYVTSVSVSLGVENSPGNASISLHIPRHVTDDFFRGGNLILTTMMEVKIYIKGHFLVGGAPRYYPVFWGVVTSVNSQWSSGERTVDLACQDILYWWTIQRININPSYLAAGVPTIGKFNTRGSGIFTGKNPFDVMYSLSRYAYGDSVNANVFLKSRQQRSEPNAAEDVALMSYWTKQWGRISHSLKMYGPNGDVIQGDLLSAVLSKENRQAAFSGRRGSSRRNRGKVSKGFELGGLDISKVSAFSEITSRIGAFDLHTSEFQTKKEIADTARQAIGYELFMDVTGEIVFKPPFYNLDVIPNQPVSWIKPIDIISESYAENPPDVTFLEGTGNVVRGTQLGLPEITKPKATYVDYRLVAKYGWKPGQYNSEFFGSGQGKNASRNMFFHLVDELDRQNARVHTGTITIPIRSELRLGYPVFVESADAYYYVEGINHNFTFSGNCTTSLTLMAKRSKFYAAFKFWNTTLANAGQQLAQAEFKQAPVGEKANPNRYPTNLYSRPIDPASGFPVGDKNVILTPDPGSDSAGPENNTHKDTETKSESALRDVVSFRSQFRVFGNYDYVYQVDPNRDAKVGAPEDKLPIKKVSLKKFDTGKRPLAVFPVSDERGYEVVGGYSYGRGVKMTRSGFDFSIQADTKSKMLLQLSPNIPGMFSGLSSFGVDSITPQAMNQAIDSRKDQVVQVDPTNYGRRLSEIAPKELSVGSVTYARGVTRNLAQSNSSPTSPSGSLAGVPDISARKKRSFKASTSVSRWRPIIDAARKAQNVSAAQYPDDVILAFIQVESEGNASARRKTKDGTYSQFNGLLQIGRDNAATFQKKNTSFRGTEKFDKEAGQDSIEHFIKIMERSKENHEYDPDRLAMTWKGGGGTTRKFNRIQKSGASEEVQVDFLIKRWGTDQYVREIRESRAIWGDPDVNSKLQDPSPEEELVVNLIGFAPEEGDLEGIKASSNLFAKAVAINEMSGVEALPSFFKPVRDPSILPHINEFLQRIYSKAFVEEEAQEKRVRGEQDIPEPRSFFPDPVETVATQLIDSPLTRPEVLESLDQGASPSEVFQDDGAWGKIQNEWNTASPSLNEDGEVDPTNVTKLPDDEGIA